MSSAEEYQQRVEQRRESLMMHQREKYGRARSRSGLRIRGYRLVSWGIVADRVERHFAAAAANSLSQNWFEHLYADRDDQLRTVQLFFGQHPVPSLGSTDVEQGAALVVSQNVLGGVIILFYPFETNAVKRTKSRVIWRILRGPEELSEGLLLKALDEFLTYSRVSSVLFSSSRWDSLTISRLERRSRLLEGSGKGMLLWDATIIILIVGSLATAGIYTAWILNNELKWPEPCAGLTALLTGWFAYLVQSGWSAIDKAMAKEEAENADRAQQQKAESSQNLPTTQLVRLP